MASELRPSLTVLPTPIPPARVGRGRRSVWPGLVLVLGCVTIPVGLWYPEARALIGWKMADTFQPGTLVVDQGSIFLSFVESGSLESTRNTTVKCEVEAVLGTVGGSSGTRSSGGGGGGGGVAAGRSSAVAMARPMSMGRMVGGVGSGKPSIRSFSYTVSPHVASRSSIPSTGSSVATVSRGSSGGGQGGGGQGGGGRSRGGGFSSERSGSTRIISILPEGSAVKAGEVVCTLDSADFRDAIEAQKIRWSQAKSWVDRVQTAMDVVLIEQREYRDGIFPQDQLLIRHYIRSCKIQEEQARMALEWGQDMFSKGLRPAAQLRGDELNHEKTALALAEALEMERRLIEFAGPRILTNLEAKIDSVRSDLLAQEAAFTFEDLRLKRLEDAMEKCILYAPADGIVVYARNTNRRGGSGDEVFEGAVVRQGQAIFQLPDPNNMCVRVRVNETKVMLVTVGQSATVRIDAFSDRPLQGTVTEVKALPIVDMDTDVNAYMVTVRLDLGGFQELKPGLSAEVAFHLGERTKATRVPVSSVRWIDGEAYAAVSEPVPGKRQQYAWQWRRLSLGLVNSTHAEILSGLQPGDRVAANPLALPTPDLNTQLARNDF